MPMRNALAVAAGLVVLVLAGAAPAQRVGSLALWKKRVFDPKALGLELYPGATFNMKFTIDQIRLDEGTDEMAVYVLPMDDVEPAAEFFAKQLGTSVEVTQRGTLGQLRTVQAKPDDAKRAGLTVRVEPAPWATGKGWIWMRYAVPAETKPAG